jgi:SP family galactose:H+ symporter-like MFS transporter
MSTVHREYAPALHTGGTGLPKKKADYHYSYLVAAMAALGGLLFGYDTGVISGAELFLVKAFHLTPSTEEIAVSAVLIGTVLGAAVGGRIADRLGRRMALLVMAVIFGVGGILTALSQTLEVFVACRILVGVAVGAASVAAPMYAAELAPPAIRGRMVFLFQLAVTIGIAVSYWTDLAFSHAGMGWRPMFAAAVVPALILGGGMMFLSDTPRWLGSKGRWDEAAAVMRRVAGDDAERQLNEVRDEIEAEKGASIRELFRPGLRLALLTGVGLGILQQLVGINTIIYYAPTIFQYAGFQSTNAAILATSVVGVVNVLATLLAVFLVDKVGRRPLILFGLVGITVSLIATGLLFAVGPSHAGVLLLACLLVYIVSFAVGMGPVFWLLSSEIFPTRLRGLGAGLSAVGNWGANLVVSITFLSLIHGAGKPVTFWIYAAFGVVAFLFLSAFVPETKGRRLEEIEAYWTNGRRWPDQK